MGRLSTSVRFRSCAARICAAAVLVGLAGFRADGATLVVTNTEDSGPGSLRQAVLTANVLPGADQVNFNISGSAPYFIKLLTELPAITDPITIDGTTQPGYASVPLVALDGDQATGIQSGAAGFRILSGNSTIRGLYIYSFGSLTIWGAGISMVGSGNNVIEGNYIGLHPYGFQFAGSTIAIECVGSSNNRIGGSGLASQNIISYNYLGLVITNRPGGVSSNNIVQGNFFGTDPGGSLARPNISDAILISGGQMNRITGNRVAFNYGHGIRVTSTNNGNTISGNLIYSNYYLGINLQPAGEADSSVTANDDGDGDRGPNALQNFPIITNLAGLDGTTVISGYLPSTPNRLFRLEFYRSTQAHQSGFGEGEVFLGSLVATTDASGFASFTFTVNGIFSNQYFTATATDEEAGDTSEFSQAIQARPGTISFERSDYTVNENAGSALLTVLRLEGAYGQVSVDFSTAAGTATPGSDFTPVAGTLLFADGENARTILLPLLDDTTDEEDENLTLNLSAPGGGALLGANSSTRLTIADDDPPPGELRLFIAPTGSRVELRFPTRKGQNYRLEQNTNLNDAAAWLPLSGAENIVGTGEPFSFSDALDATAAGRYYRIRQLP